MPRADLLRLFWAIDLPLEVRNLATQIQARCRPNATKASWPDAQNLHLTLAFLGDVNASLVPSIVQAGRVAASIHHRFSLHTADLGGFPSSRKARVLWLGAEPTPNATALAESLRSAMVSLGIPCDDKPFKPHLTLARFKIPTDIRIFESSGSSMVFEVSELVLYQSHLSSHGSTYTALGRAALG